MNTDTIQKGKSAMLIFWVAALIMWVVGWTGGIGGIVLGLAKLFAVAHIAEMFIFGDTIEASEKDTVEERINVFIYGYFRVKELQLEQKPDGEDTRHRTVHFKVQVRNLQMSDRRLFASTIHS